MTYTAEQLRRIADLLDTIEAGDPPDKDSPVYMKPISLTNNDGENMGTISDPDGTGYFWTPGA